MTFLSIVGALAIGFGAVWLMERAIIQSAIRKGVPPEHPYTPLLYRPRNLPPAPVSQDSERIGFKPRRNR